MLNTFINDTKSFADLNKLIKNLPNKQKISIFREFVKMVFIYHPIYNDFTEKYYTYDMLTSKQKKELSLNRPTSLCFILLKTQKWSTVQIVFVNNPNDEIVFDKYDVYDNDIFYQHLCVTNSNNPIIPKTTCLTGNFFNNIKPEFFTFLKYKLSKQLYIFPQLVPTTAHTALINKIVNTNIKTIEHEFNTNIILNHFWINQELNSKITVVVVNDVIQLIKIFNDSSYQKMINNYKQHFILVSSDVNSYGFILLNDKNDIIENINLLVNKDINLTIIVTFNDINILVDSLNILNIKPDLCISYNSNNVMAKRELIITYNLIPDYSLSSCSLISSVNSNDQPAKFIKTNIMDYLEITEEEGNIDKIVCNPNKGATKNIIHIDTLDKWEIEYQELFNMSQNDEMYNTLINKQLYKLQSNKLSKTQIDKLELLKGWDDIGSDRKISLQWISVYNKLFKWVSKNGYPLQCSENSEESLLYVFLYEQILNGIDRCKYRYEKMTDLLRWDDFFKLYKQMDNWALHYNVLIKWININCRMPRYSNNINLEEYQLLQFIELQKINYKKQTLSNDKIEILSNICDFTWTNSNNDLNDMIIWDMLYQELKIYIINNNVIPNDDTKLGVYVKIQKQSKYILTDKQINKLELLPLWIWDDFVSLWDLTYDKVVLYSLMNNEFPNIEFITEEDKKIEIFMNMQKKLYDIDALSKEQVDKLELLSFWDDNTHEFIFNRNHTGQNNKVMKKMLDWENKYNDLLKWHEIHDYAPRRNNNDEHEKILNYFIDKQKKLQKNGLLSEYKTKKLELLPHWNWISQKITNNEEWDNSFNELTIWLKDNARIPMYNIENNIEKKLFWFCNDQKILKLDGKLDNKKVKKLESLKYWSWDNKTNSGIASKKWNNKYDILSEWVNTKGKYPTYGSKDALEENLVTFIYNNRYLYHKNKLNGEQIDKLEKLKNWTWHKDKK
jgi:hypothetical protein